MPAPTGTVAFLFTDVTGSTELWTRDRDGMSASLRLHDELIRGVVDRREGYVFATGGDGFCVAFPSATVAVDAARDIQREIAGAHWPGPELVVRIGVHLGDAEERDGDYFGPVVNLAARLVGAAHGGQVLVTDAVVSATAVPDARDVGGHRLRGIDGDVRLHQVGPGDFPTFETEPETPTVLRFGDHEVDFAARELRADGVRIHVEPQVFDVVAHLVMNRDRLVPREELLDEVWGDQFVSLSALTSRIKTARQALGDDGRAQRVIRTERGRGYQFVARIDRADDADETEARVRSEGGTPEEPVRSHAVGVERGISLTRDLGPFLGRDRERAEVTDLLDAAALVTVVGPGGVGKTRLATELARAWRSDASRSVAFMALDTVREPDALGRSLATMLGIDAPPDGDLLGACAQALGGRDQLLVLDNCEHVTAAARDVAAVLLERSPSLVVLATSREPLQIRDEHVYRLAPLEVPAAAEDIDAESPGPCLELFEAAARRADAGFRLGDSNLEDAADLCRQLDGLPLALELAASRLGSLGIADLRRVLGDRLDAIRTGPSGSTQRHHSLRSAVEWSLRLLDEPTREAFALLSAFPAGLTLAEIEVCCARFGSPVVVVDLVSRLVDASMLVRDSADGGAARYRMLETLRQAGQEELVRLGLENDADTAVVEHARAISDGLRRTWSGEPADVGTHREICDEIPNLRAARNVMLDRGDVEGLIALSSGLLPVTEEACLAELWSWHDEIEDLAMDPTAHAAASVAMLSGIAARNQGRLDDAKTLTDRAVSLTDDTWIQSRSIHAKAMVSLYGGDLLGASALWLQEAQLTGACRSRLFAAMAHAYTGDGTYADELMASCGAAFTDPRPPVVVNAHFVAGELARVAGRATALESLQTAVDIAREHELWFSWGVAQVSLASLLADAGETAKAAASFIELIERWVRSATWPQLWTTLRNVANLLDESDDDVRLMIWVAAAEDPLAPALDDQTAANTAAAMEAGRRRLGAASVEEIERTARRTGPVDLAARAVDALGSVGR